MLAKAAANFSSGIRLLPESMLIKITILEQDKTSDYTYCLSPYFYIKPIYTYNDANVNVKVLANGVLQQS